MENKSTISSLQLIREFAFRRIGECNYCSLRCRKNRYKEKGACGLDYRAFYAEPFIHIGEEAPINPAIVVNFSGCSWACAYCIQGDELKDASKFLPLNVNTFWLKIKKLLESGCPENTLEFAGGDPTISIHWILEILLSSPENFKLPIVWNCNTSLTDEALKLLDGVVDVYLVDFRYGNDKCAKRLSKVENFWQHATNAIESMISQKARIIIRILVLPNHVDCCHEKALEWLSQYKDYIWISILDQYVPEHMAKEYEDINRGPTPQEIEAVEHLVQKYGLRDIKEHPEEFWT